jgi:acylphosphatase
MVASRASSSVPSSAPRLSADGTVRVHIEGAPEAVAAVAAACTTGPAGARVERVEEREVAAEGLEGFEIG